MEFMAPGTLTTDAHPAKVPCVAPMSILFRDEKYKAEIIEIIRQLMDDAKLSGNSQVCIAK